MNDDRSPRPLADGQHLLLIVRGSRCERLSLPRDGALSIGRSQGSDLRLIDDRVSRRHARLRMADGRCWIADLGSQNGTRLNGRTVDGEWPLAIGDVVTIADAALVMSARSGRGARVQAAAATVLRRIDGNGEPRLRAARLTRVGYRTFLALLRLCRAS